MSGKINGKISTLIKILVRPSHVSAIAHDLLRLNHRLQSDESHLRSAMEWLCKAQDISGCGGVSAGYSFTGGWLPPYPETTGYIIPTFLRYYSFSGESSYAERAVRMGDWEIDIQLPTGAVRGGVGINDYPIVFNTGQVILGWTALYRETNLTRFLEASRKAADWLVSIQDSDGKWSRDTYMGIPHTYNTRVAWPLLELYSLWGDERHKVAAEKNITWALKQATSNGWFRHMGFGLDEIPITHTIAYTLEGLIESSPHVNEKTRLQILDVVQKACNNLMMRYELRKPDHRSMPRYLPATFDENWESRDDYSCLTGNAQVAIVLMKLFTITGEDKLLQASVSIIDDLKASQKLDSSNPGIRGGLPGSNPIWARYQQFCYPNWSSKFFADAIMHKHTILNQTRNEDTGHGP